MCVGTGLTRGLVGTVVCAPTSGVCYCTPVLLSAEAGQRTNRFQLKTLKLHDGRYSVHTIAFENIKEQTWDSFVYLKNVTVKVTQKVNIAGCLTPTVATWDPDPHPNLIFKTGPRIRIQKRLDRIRHTTCEYTFYLKPAKL